MDVNNTPFLLLREPDEFHQLSSRMHWDYQQKCLKLAPNQDLWLPASDPALAISEWQNARPLVQDGFGQLAMLSPDNSQILVNGGDGFKPLVDDISNPVVAPVGEFTDLTIGPQNRLAALYSDGADNHGVLTYDLQKRWQRAAQLTEPGIRCCVDASHSVWVVTENTVAQFMGEPLPHPYQPSAESFEPVTINPRPFSLHNTYHWQPDQATVQAMALASDKQYLYLLCHDFSGNQLIWRAVLHQPSQWQSFAIESEVPFSSDMAVYEPGTLGLLPPAEAGDDQFRRRDCPLVHLVWDSSGESGARLVRRRYPMINKAGQRFVAMPSMPLHYPAESDSQDPEVPARPRPLLPLQRPRYYTTAEATLLNELDSGQPNCVWHRLYVDGHIPKGTQIQIQVRCFNELKHRTKAPFITQTALLHSPLESELPGGASLSRQCLERRGKIPSDPKEYGLYELLLQHPKGEVRRLTGRYLQIRLELTGNATHTPAIHAIRVYYGRFCYQDNYFPNHMRQEQVRSFNNQDSNANGADVRERFLGAFEGMLTPIEGNIATSERLLHPRTCPSANLDWLARCLGTELPNHWPEHRKRRHLACIGLLQKWRGTLNGIALALDIMTDGAVARGEIVVVENFRLRRTMATILGVSMDDKDHPLTLGTGQSGNSIIGDSLILSEQHARQFLALFAPELAQQNNLDQKTVKRFFDQYADRVTVLLHGPAKAKRVQVQEVIDQQLPAHIQYQIFETDLPFVLGLSPLLSVDTWLENTPPFRQVVLNDTALGREGVLRNPAALDPEKALYLSSQHSNTSHPDIQRGTLS